MLHTFSATGYECAAADYETLEKMNLVCWPSEKENWWFKTLNESTTEAITGRIKNIEWRETPQ
jgi:hypothetical protein